MDYGVRAQGAGAVTGRSFYDETHGLWLLFGSLHGGIHGGEPLRRRTPPLSARQISASISLQCSLTRYSMPGPVEASSPASDTKITSRSRGTCERLSISMVIRAALRSLLSSSVPGFVDVAALPSCAEGREGPLGEIDADRIAVAHDEERFFGSIAFQAGDQVGAGGVFGYQGQRECLRRPIPFLTYSATLVSLPVGIGAVDLDQSSWKWRIASSLILGQSGVWARARAGRKAPRVSEINWLRMGLV